MRLGVRHVQRVVHRDQCTITSSWKRSLSLRCKNSICFYLKWISVVPFRGSLTFKVFLILIPKAVFLLVSSASCSYASAAWSSHYGFWFVISNKSWNMNWADWSKRPDSFLRLCLTLKCHILVALFGAPGFFIFLLFHHWIWVFKNRLRSLLSWPNMTFRSEIIRSVSPSNISLLTSKNLSKSARLIWPF